MVLKPSSVEPVKQWPRGSSVTLNDEPVCRTAPATPGLLIILEQVVGKALYFLRRAII